MSIVKILFLVVFIFISDIFSQQNIDGRVKNGMDAYYNFNWNRGDQLFNDLIDDLPDNPVGYHYLSIRPLWYFLGSFNEAYFDTFFIYSDKALDLAKKMEDDSLSDDLAYLMSCIYANRSIANARNENYINAAWDSERMKYYSRKALDLNEQLTDAKLGLGLYNLAVSQIPLSLQWAIELAGVDADRETGLNYLNEVTKNGKLSRTDAKFYLSQIFTRTVIDYDVAESLLKQLTLKYPKNLLFRMSYAWIEVENGKLFPAERKFKSIISSEEENFPIIKSLSLYQLGNINFYKGNLDSAIFYYKDFLENNLRKDYVGITNFNLGLAFEMSGKRDSAIVYYKNTDGGNTDLDEDTYAKRRGGIFKDDSLSDQQISILRFSNQFKSGNYKIVRELLSNFLQDSLENDIRAETLLLLSKTYLKLKKYNETIFYSAQTMECKIENENWIYPFALIYGAQASYNLKNYMDAQLFLNLISDYSDYDFSLLIEGHRYALQRKLNKLNSKISK